jgi:plasmid replication initiation protein
MHEGSNGVWIYTRFSDILPSEIITEYGKGYEKRMEKLNRVIDKCRRYGIGVYVFAIEPVALTPELEDKYAEYKELNRNVIKKAVDEINELTDLSIDYRPIREGKRIVSIEFKVQCLNDEITQQIALEQISLDEV